MKRIKKHIAFSLLVIFFAPIALQSIHVLRHHALGYKVKPNGLHHHHHSLAAHQAQADVVVYELEKTCHICEFQFAVNDLPQLSSYRSYVPILPLSYPRGDVALDIWQLWYRIPPRAPPYTLS